MSNDHGSHPSASHLKAWRLILSRTAVPSMYNLLVSSNAEAWSGEPWQVEFSRCFREYTENAITERFGELNDAAISELKRLPCIFAYEAFNLLAPKFGLIRDIAKRQGQVRIEYELQTVDPFLSADDLEQLTFELDIGKWEMTGRTGRSRTSILRKNCMPRGVLRCLHGRGRRPRPSISPGIISMWRFPFRER